MNIRGISFLTLVKAGNNSSERAPGNLGRSSPAETKVWPERRIYERYEIDTELTATLLPDRKEQMHGRSLDISMAGIAGVFVAGWEMGTRVLLEFSVPVTKQQLAVEAVVRNRVGHRYGFEFLNLSGRDRALINKTIRVLALFSPGS